LDEITPDIVVAPEPPPPPAPRLPFRLPAEYYESPGRTPVIPRTVPFGCGAAAVVFLIALFIAGTFADRFMPWIFGFMQNEIDGQFTKDVTAAQKAEFDAEFNTLRVRMKSGRANLKRLQPLLQKITETTSDDHVTPAETQTLIEALREANAAAPPSR
jgi:hypothetical protein